MPLYEYHCKECKKESEVLVRGSEQAECPACGSKKMEELLSVSAAPSISGSSLRPLAQRRRHADVSVRFGLHVRLSKLR